MKNLIFKLSVSSFAISLICLPQIVFSMEEDISSKLSNNRPSYIWKKEESYTKNIEGNVKFTECLSNCYPYNMGDANAFHKELTSYEPWQELPLNGFLKAFPFKRFHYFFIKCQSNEREFLTSLDQFLFYPHIYKSKDAYTHSLEQFNKLLGLLKTSESNQPFLENLRDMLIEMTKARLSFVETHCESINFLLLHGYILSKNDFLQSPLANKNKPWMDLHSSLRYFQTPLGEIDKVVNDLRKAGVPQEKIEKMKEELVKQHSELLPPSHEMNSPSLRNLQKKIDNYHKIPKTITTSITLIKRIMALGKIADACVQLQNQHPECLALQALQTTAFSKKDSLKDLHNHKQNIDRRAFALPNQNLSIVRPKTGAFCHKHQLIIPFGDIFLDSIDTSEISEIDEEAKKLRALDKKVTFVNGIGMTPIFNYKLLKANDKDLSASFSSVTEETNEQQVLDGIYIFAIDQNDDLYILPDGRGSIAETSTDTNIRESILKTLEINQRTTHPYLIKNDNALLAGELRFEKGHITEINNASGHYGPRIWNLACGLDRLLVRNPGVFDPNHIKIDALHGSRKYKFSYSELLEQAKDAVTLVKKEISAFIELKSKPHHRDLSDRDKLNEFIKKETQPERILERELEVLNESEKSNTVTRSEEEAKRITAAKGFAKMRMYLKSIYQKKPGALKDYFNALRVTFDHSDLSI